MKKILSLTVPPGLVVILFIIILSYVPASASTGGSTLVGENNRSEQAGPPWFDEAWHYRRAVVISNDGTSLSYYQVLIKLDINNFVFSRAKPDGSDVRFTHSDGTTELKFWIESWDNLNRLAYVWVRVPAVSPGDTPIYLYYGNPEASSASDGNSTFDSFDDNWIFNSEGSNQSVEPAIQQTTEEVYSPFEWEPISGTPEVIAGILNLADGTGIKSSSSYQFRAVGMRANYSLNSTDEWIGFINGTSGPRTLISDNKAGNVDDIYLLDTVNGSDFDYVVLPKVEEDNWHGDMHVYELRWELGQSRGDIDHGASTASSNLPGLVPNVSLPVSIYNDTDSGGTLLVDWVYVRQYRDPEPISSVQGEQGLVELSIEDIDYPDPVRKDAKLTYQLTIANSSSINAPGVVVTDTLPGNIQIGSISPSQGTCEPGSVVLCDLNILSANTTATITIVVTPTVEGIITNTVAVGSLGYELDLRDNSSVESTVVDSTPPEVVWVKPVTNGNVFITFDRIITFETTASDNDQINRVEFWWYDGENYWHIDTVITPPYHSSFDTSVLQPGIPYWFEARAYDRAGNSNFPYNRSYIYIIRHPINYLPLMYK